MRKKCYLLLVLLTIAVCCYAQQYEFPGKFIFCIKENINVLATAPKDLELFKEKIEEIFLAEKLFQIFNPERMNPLTESQFLSVKKHRPSHIIFYWLKVDYQPLAAGGRFALTGQIAIERLHGGEMAGLIWKRASARLRSDQLGLQVRDVKDHYQRQRCIERLAKQLAYKMIDLLTPGGLLAPCAIDHYLDARLCQQAFRPGDCISVDFSWQPKAPGAYYLYIFYFQHSGAIDMFLPNFRKRRQLIQPGTSHSWPGTKGRKVSRTQARQAIKKWGLSRITAEGYNERILLLLSAKPVSFLELAFECKLNNGGKILSLRKRDLKTLRQQLKGEKYCSALLDVIHQQ